MKHKSLYRGLQHRLQEMIHSRKPPHIPSTEKDAVGNGEKHHFDPRYPVNHDSDSHSSAPSSLNGGAVRSQPKDNCTCDFGKDWARPKKTFWQQAPNTGLGDMGMKTSFDVTPVGTTPVISKGLPVGHPKFESFRKFMEFADPDADDLSKVGNSFELEPESPALDGPKVPNQIQMLMQRLFKRLDGRNPRVISAAMGQMNQMANQEVGERGTSQQRRFTTNQIKQGRQMRSAI